MREDLPGAAWAARFEQYWPAYRRWWLSEGEAARPGLAECRAALETHMPEFVALHEQLAALAGGGDLKARFLSMYRPPPYLAGCSQAVWQGAEPLLVRNYDYDPRAFDALCLHTTWLGRKVLGLSDCLVGLLDGVNEDGLALSLTFGGRRVVGPGFGIPIVLRYVLETCATVDEAVAALTRIPCHMAYNVTVLDKSRTYRTVYISPDHPAEVSHSAVATNHQPEMAVGDLTDTSTSLERESYLLQELTRHPGTAEEFMGAFSWPPLYSFRFDAGFGTLYTAAYRPADRSLALRWPGTAWDQAIDRFDEGTRLIEYRY